MKPVYSLQGIISHVAKIDVENYQTKQPILTCEGCGHRYIKCREPQVVCIVCINDLVRQQRGSIIRNTGTLTSNPRATLHISDTTPTDGMTDTPVQLNETTNDTSYLTNDSSDLDKLPDDGTSSRFDEGGDRDAEARTSDLAITLRTITA